MSNLVGKFRKGTTYKVSFPTLPGLTSQPRLVDLSQAQYKHDVLVLEYAYLSEKYVKLLKTGVPITFTWTQGSRTKTWYGYVSSSNKIDAAQKKKTMRVNCVGASYVLKKKSRKVYKNKTVPEIAEEIASKNKLKFVGESDTRVFPQLSISGQSQWDWLQQMAKKIGYGMYMDGTSLVFLPIDKILDASLADVPLFQMWNETIPRSDVHLDRTLDKLQILNGENIEEGEFSKSIKNVSGVDPVTSKSFTSAKSPSSSGKKLRSVVSDSLFDEFRTDLVALTAADAKKAAEAAAQLARFNLPAQAEGQGDPRVSPYSLVEIEGSNEMNDGQWLVRAVTHSFKWGGHYLLEMQVATDGTYANANVGSRQGYSSSSGGKRTSRTSKRSVINIPAILATSDAQAAQGFTGGMSLTSLVSSTGSVGNSTPSARLSVATPLYNNIINQGVLRTPSVWQATSPSASSIRKCRCNCR